MVVEASEVKGREGGGACVCEIGSTSPFRFPSQGVDYEVEGCLSFPEMNGEVMRHKWIKVEALNLKGKKFKKKFTGFEARLFQVRPGRVRSGQVGPGWVGQAGSGRVGSGQVGEAEIPNGVGPMGAGRLGYHSPGFTWSGTAGVRVAPLSRQGV